MKALKQFYLLLTCQVEELAEEIEDEHMRR